jgi:DNA-binding NarL/FixJ family response regulator
MGVRILIAEDHPLVRRCVRDIIEAQPGWTVCAETGDGTEVLALAGKTRPDVAVLDLSLPGVGGLLLTQRLNEALPEVAVLILTMNDDEDMVAHCLGAGARGYVLKTDAEQHLASAITTALTGGGTYVSPSIPAQLGSAERPGGGQAYR